MKIRCTICQKPLMWPDNMGVGIQGTDLYFCGLDHEEKFRAENDLTEYLHYGATLEGTQLDMRWTKP